MVTFLSIVFFVFGVLQIILFFKLWGMTNDVRSMKEQISKDGEELKCYIKSINEHLRKIETSTQKESGKE